MFYEIKRQGAYMMSTQYMHDAAEATGPTTEVMQVPSLKGQAKIYDCINIKTKVQQFYTETSHFHIGLDLTVKEKVLFLLFCASEI